MSEYSGNIRDLPVVYPFSSKVFHNLPFLAKKDGEPLG